MGPRPVEISDLLLATDARGERRPVRLDDVVGALEATGQRRAARTARRLLAAAAQGPERVVPDAAVDRLLLRAHCELQRLGEELQQPSRIAETLRPWVAELRRRDPGAPVRVVDVGCGLGLVPRSLAATGELGPGVELVGVDLNPALTRHAAALAAHQGLDCRFLTGDAFEPGLAVEVPARTLVVSSGLVHHLAPAELAAFFAAQQRLGVHAFAHWDVAPGPWSTLGAWMFHRARMREPLARHDGVLSARRAHPAEVLRAAAVAGAPGYAVAVAPDRRRVPRLVDVLRPVTGVRAEGAWG